MNENPSMIMAAESHQPKGGFWKVMAVTLVVIVAAVYAIRSVTAPAPWSSATVNTAPTKDDVVRVASHYIRDQYPAAEDVDEGTAVIKNVWIGSQGGEWDFAIAVKGKNSFGAHTRNAVAGTVEWGGGDKWKLKHIENRAIGSALK